MTLKVVRDCIFEEIGVDIVTTYQKKQRVWQWLHCYHVAEEEDLVEENPHNIKIPKVEGERELEGPNIDSEYYAAPLNIKKENIGTIEHPKIASIGYYWDNQTVERITESLCEYSELFLTKFLEMKGLTRELGEMKVPLKP